MANDALKFVDSYKTRLANNNLRILEKNIFDPFLSDNSNLTKPIKKAVQEEISMKAVMVTNLNSEIKAFISHIDSCLKRKGKRAGLFKRQAVAHFDEFERPLSEINSENNPIGNKTLIEPVPSVKADSPARKSNRKSILDLNLQAQISKHLSNKISEIKGKVKFGFTKSNESLEQKNELPNLKKRNIFCCFPF